LGLEDVCQYAAYLDDHPAEWSRLDECCRISISRFYRDRHVFDLLRDEVLPKLARKANHRDEPQVRVWCAGCASGEEVYTLKIIWELSVRPHHPGITLSLTATDAEPHMLARTRCGQYPRSSLKDFPTDWIAIAFKQHGEEYTVKSQFRGGIKTQLQDIRCEQPAGRFDLILCRHLVFTYFEESVQATVLSSILEHLHPNGFLVTGKQESLPTEASIALTEYEPHSGIYGRHDRAASHADGRSTVR
jgi:chemotaxis protein methyltransferase CheR